MKPGQFALIGIAAVAVAGAVIIQRGNSETIAAGSAQVAKKSKSEANADKEKKKAAAPQPKPEVFFLDESGTEASANRPQANKLPKVNGNRSISNIRPVTTRAEGDFMAPVWSPDGLELMFSKAGYSGLYTKGLLGGDITQVSSKDNIGFNAKWTKDGKIATKTNDGEVQEFNPDGTPAGSASPVDDSSVTGPFSVNDTVFYRANPGEAPVPVSAGEDRYYGGVVSPDGKHIVYNGLETGIYVKPLDGSSPPVNIGYGTNPTFTPDGNSIVYNVTQDDGHNLVAGDIYQSSLDGSVTHDLTDSSPAIETKPIVSPDGDKLAFESDGIIYVSDFN